MKIRQSTLALFLCITLLGACATPNTPQPNTQKTPTSTACSVTETARVAGTSTLPSATGSWPTFHGDSNRDGAAPASGNGNILHLAWTFCTGGAVFSSPVVQDGVAYIASTSTTLTAIDIASARMLWQIQAGDAFYGTPTVLNGVLYIGSLDGTIYAVNTKDGFVRWHTQIDTPGAKIWSSPALANGLLIIGAASTLSENPKRAGQVLAFDTTTGKMRWRAYIEQGGKAGGGLLWSPAIDVASKTVYVGTGDPDDGVEALNLQTGHVLWHWRSVVQDIGDTDVGAGPLLYSNNKKQLRVVVGGKNGNIYNLDGKTGKLLWHTMVGQHVFSSPTYANGALYTIGLTGHSATVSVLDAQTGKARWHSDIPTIIYASPAVSGKALYVATGDAFVAGDGGITVLNTTNGQQIQSINVHSAMTSSPAVLSAWVLVGARDGNLYAYIR